MPPKSCGGSTRSTWKTQTSLSCFTYLPTRESGAGRAVWPDSAISFGGFPVAIRAIEQGPYCGPQVFCDVCRKLIKDADDGNAMWKYDNGTIYFTHKVGCTEALEEGHGGDWGADDLDTWLVYLTNSLKLDWKKASVKAKSLASIGI
jgi:hypothetical protein